MARINNHAFRHLHSRRGLCAAILFIFVCGWRASTCAGGLVGDDTVSAARGAKAASSRHDSPTSSVDSGAADPADVEFFEKRVRPILSARCQGCHGPDKQKGGLRLDARATALSGGATGPAVVPGNPKESLLVDAINYGETYKMPPKSKLPADEIATLTEWVQRGAPWGADPRTDQSQATPKTPGTLSNDEFLARARFWSFQPLRLIAPPAVWPAQAGWARNPIDRFILAKLEQQNLAPAPEAGRETLIRRLSFDLLGLPPEPSDVEAFLTDRATDAYEKLVERMLASPHYGERWGRHWLDLVRYAETAGHEFDYDIPNAFRYRDYVIRALNADVPYDQFVVEHIAGDTLEHPRRHPTDGHNESAIGVAFFTLGEGTHSPVDIREEQMRRIDNQLDVLSKTFMGLTLACARCHDHKFDPITSRDYYAMAGYLASSRHSQAFIDPPHRIGQLVKSLRCAKDELMAIVRNTRDQLPEPARKQATALLVLAASSDPASLTKASQGASAAAQGSLERVFDDFNRGEWGNWFVTGDAFGAHPTRSGDIRLDRQGNSRRLVSIAPGFAHSGLESDRLQGVLRSRSFTIDSRFIHILTCGNGGRISVVIDGFEKIRSPIYGGLTTVVGGGAESRWVTFDVQMWAGHSCYLEIADGAVVDYSGPTSQVDIGHGWVAVDEILMSDLPAPSRAAQMRCGSIERAALDLTTLAAAIRPARPELADRLTQAVSHADTLDRKIPDPTLAPSQAEGTGIDEHILIRGSHKNPGAPVPRRFLAVLGGREPSFRDHASHRDELARQMVDPAIDPLVPRVLVNRLWQHHFGEGIVRSTDDFGAMGHKPSHPELLDWLARTFVERGWSIKSMHRLLVTSSAYRMSSRLEPAAEKIDPGNTLLHRMNVRRLEAEAIRDEVLAISGQLKRVMYGLSVPVYLTSHMEGRGRPLQSGALDGDGRRTIYLNVRRNFLSPMLLSFDAPLPFSTMGRRNVSNVPAQALALLNDPLVLHEARYCAERVVAQPAVSLSRRLESFFLAALSRKPTPEETQASLDFLTRRAATGAEPGLDAWADLCHVIINMKEFIFVD